ncbi:AtpZ/AtpI family protein [Gemmatimonas sp.]|uniref:AtpZ/AtpI family protein n=1 Tax=Gemmatimonas sp. TaxID=1962908 RepID=UPI00286E2133|nr:AtpZ/AtpI family protein [Gemmatimonas sp.]
MADEPRNPIPGSTPPGEQSPWALAGLGMQFFASILLFVYAGNWLDRRFDTSPLFLLGGLFVGGGGAFYASYRRLTKPTGTRSTDDTDSLPKP